MARWLEAPHESLSISSGRSGDDESRLQGASQEQAMLAIVGHGPTPDS